MAFTLHFSAEADLTLTELERDQGLHQKLVKIRRAMARLESNPRHPGLQSHKYESIHGPNGEEVWESYVENRTPGGWRIWWWYGPDRGQITILTIGPHPD